MDSYVYTTVLVVVMLGEEYAGSDAVAHVQQLNGTVLWKLTEPGMIKKAPGDYKSIKGDQLLGPEKNAAQLEERINSEAMIMNG